MDALVSSVLFGIFNLFPVPVSELPFALEFVPAHSLSIQSEVTRYRLAGAGEMERLITRNFRDTVRKENERALYHLDSSGNVLAWEEYGPDSLLRIRGSSAYSQGHLQATTYQDSAGKIIEIDSATWSGDTLKSTLVIFPDADTTLTEYVYEEGHVVKYFTPSLGPGNFTAISYPSPDTIRGDEYRDSLIAFTTLLIFQDGKLAKVQSEGATTTYRYGDASVIRARPEGALRRAAGFRLGGYDGLGRRRPSGRSRFLFKQAAADAQYETRSAKP